MDPKFNKIVWFFDRILFGRKHSLEHICQMSAVEGVMEILGGLLEVFTHLRMKTKGGFDDCADFFLNSFLELGKMSGKIGGVHDRK